MRRSLAALLAAGVWGAALAQDAPAPPLNAELVKTGLYLITGGGANSLLRLSASGSILVDGKLPASYRPLMSQIRKISKLSDLPVRVLIVSDHHEAHTGNPAQFMAAGVALIAQQNARPHLPASDAAAPPASGARPAGPIVVFDREYKLKMGGVEAQLFHFGKAHTDNDTVVFFPDLKVVTLGHLFSRDAPVPDFAGGGSLVGWGPVLDQVLQLDFDIVVPGDGPLASRADLLAFRAKLATVVARAKALVKQGVTQERLPAELTKTDDLGWQFQLDAEQGARLYAELLQLPQ